MISSIINTCGKGFLYSEFLRYGKLWGSTYAFGVVNMRICEVVSNKRKPSAKAGQGKASKRDGRTEFERNTSKLRSKERKLNPQRSIAPVKHTS